MPARRQYPARTIAKFVRSTALWRRVWFVFASVATHGLGVGVVLYLVDWANPVINAEVQWGGVAWLSAVLLWQLLHPGLSLQSADGVFGLQDRLVTWWSVRGRRDDGATRWLAADLSHSLTDLPASTRGRLWRRPARRLLWVLPLLVLVYWIGPLGRLNILPSPFGVTQPHRDAPTASRGKSGEAERVAGRDGSGAKSESRPPQPKPKQPKPKQPKPKQPKPKQPKPKQPQRPGEQPRPEPKPRPMLPLPGKDEFVIPKFVGEGAGKKKKAPVAVIEETAGGAVRRTSGSSGKTRSSQPDAREREFKRARERAVRARHVPARERGFVRRYFDELQREGRKRP